IPDCLAFVSTFFFCLVVSFILSWKLALAALPFTLFFIVPGLVFGKLMMDVIMKMIESYGVAGGIAEQAISSIRTVYSYVAENQTLEKFSSALEKTLELGIKQGFAKGLMMGSMGSIYIGWAFQAFVGTYLVTEIGEKGGSIFVAGINIIMGGLSILGALPNLTGITEATVAATRIFEMVDRVPTIDTEDKKGKALSYQMASKNESSDESSYQTEGRRRHKMHVAPSPISYRSSAASTPALNPFSPALSIGTPYSYTIQYDPDDESVDENMDQMAAPAPSQWRLLKMNAPEWGRALVGSMAALGSGAVQPINAYCVGLLISIYFRPDKAEIKSKSRTLSFVFLGIGALNFTSSLLQHYNFAVMGEKLTKRIREKFLQKLMTFEISWFDQEDNTSAAVCTRLATEANMVRSLVGDRMSLLVQAIFGSLFAYAVALKLSWRLSIVMIAVQPIVVGSFYARSMLMKSMAGKAQKAQKEGSQLASEAVVNHRTITAFSSQKRMLGLFKETLKGPKEESVRHSWLSGLGLFSSQFSNTAFSALAYWYGGRLLIKGLITSEHLFQAFLVLVFTAYVIAEAGSMTNDLSKGSAAVRSVFAILDRRSEIDPENQWGLEIKKAIKGKIELRNVFFAYPTRPDQMIFKGLNLRIDAGRTVALVGQSGSGKSTIIGLIERFYDPMKGSVSIDGQDVKNYNLRMLRTHIALVSQEPTLFAGTIRENIAYGKENAKESEIRKASKLANAHEFISGMKDGYDTNCGERGVQLSGGQKQRIALARAILKNPTILLLDEATSALDSVSESLVQEALEKMMVGRTCVIVAHRLSTIQKADTIAVIKNGKVAEQGSHNELISLGRGGAYHSLTKLQGGNSPYRR
ncbi:hypothetical protein CCACVL1_12897, partial [Corchorus capsularis]